MNRSHVVTTLVSIVSGAGLLLVACSDQPQDDTGDPAGYGVTARSSEARTFCGNKQCDHHETCSSCPQDCGTCGGTAGTTGSAGTTGGGGTTGSGGTTGTGGTTGICGSTAAPPTHYQHVVIFSFENRTWSQVGLGYSPMTAPYLHSLASQCSYFADWTETNTGQNSLTQYIGGRAASATRTRSTTAIRRRRADRRTTTSSGRCASRAAPHEATSKA